jgi:two-component system, LuxR family, sensor kinase FixL
VAELIEKAANQTSRAGQIIRQLRDFVEKRESARFEVSPNKVVEEAIALAAVGSADANVKTFVQLAPNLPLVLIDKIQIQQVIINLIRNSIEAMQSEAKRELRIMTSGAEGGGVRLDVRDSGPGLSPEVASRLFHPFVTTKEKGMGIGLSICHSIVEAHGGRIWATANDSGGVTFHVQLPPSPVELT